MLFCTFRNHSSWLSMPSQDIVYKSKNWNFIFQITQPRCIVGRTKHKNKIFFSYISHFILKVYTISVYFKDKITFYTRFIFKKKYEIRLRRLEAGVDLHKGHVWHIYDLCDMCNMCDALFSFFVVTLWPTDWPTVCVCVCADALYVDQLQLRGADVRVHVASQPATSWMAY